MGQAAKVTAYLNPGTLADDATIGTIAWTGATDAASSNNVYASAAMSGTTSFVVEDEDIKLVKGGVIGGNNNSADADWTTTDAYVAFGGATDLWGQTWKATDINATTFGFVAACRRVANGSPISHYLKATNFGFALPSSSKIVGIEASFERAYANDVSFVEGTLVTTPTNKVRIEKLGPGSRVLSYNKELNRFERDRATKIKTRIVDTVYSIQTAGKLIYATDQHQFFTPTGLVRAKYIRVGTKVRTEFTGIPIIERVERTERHKGRFRVYSIEVEKNHSYIANGFVVHNVLISGSTEARIDHMRLRVYYHPARDVIMCGTGFVPVGRT